MKKTTYKLFSGILTAVVLFMIGDNVYDTYYVQDAGTKTGCRNGWIDVEDLEFRDQWGCQTASGIRYEACFKIWNSSNTKNYWCQRGILVNIEEEIKQTPVSGTPSGNRHHYRSTGCIDCI